VREFLTAMAICHQCTASKDPGTGQLRYEGASQDEITLVDAARYMGY